MFRCDVGSRIHGSAEDLPLYHPAAISSPRGWGQGAEGKGVYPGVSCTMAEGRQGHTPPREVTGPRRLRRPATLRSCHAGNGCPVLVGAYIRGWPPCMGRPPTCGPVRYILGTCAEHA